MSAHHVQDVVTWKRKTWLPDANDFILAVCNAQVKTNISTECCFLPDILVRYFQRYRAYLGSSLTCPVSPLPKLFNADACQARKHLRQMFPLTHPGIACPQISTKAPIRERAQVPWSHDMHRTLRNATLSDIIPLAGFQLGICNLSKMSTHQLFFSTFFFPRFLSFFGASCYSCNSHYILTPCIQVVWCFLQRQLQQAFFPHCLKRSWEVFSETPVYPTVDHICQPAVYPLSRLNFISLRKLCQIGTDPL